MYGGGGDYDGSSAAFMGGGFMPSQANTQPLDSSYSLPKNREGRCLMPLTVKQIRELSSNDDSTFLSGGVEVTNVTIVGRVCRKEDKASEYTFLVDDGTAQIECTRWIQEQLDTVELEGIAIGAYVRVHGHLRGLQGRRFIIAFSIRPIADFNEVPSHFIECIYVHFYNTKHRGVTGQPQATTTPIKGYQSGFTNQSSTYYGMDGVNDIGQTILKFLQQPVYLANEDGVHRDVMASQLNIPMDKLMEEIQSLVDNGFIYPTIDDDHFKSTVNG